MPANTTLNSTIQAIINNHTVPVQLAANPVPTPLPAGIATTALDWQPIPVFGIPLWAIVAVLSFAALVLVFIHWSDKSRDLDAIKPWFIKVKELALGKIQVIRLSRAGNFIPDCLNIFDNVMSYGDSDENINQWYLSSPRGVIRIGGIPAPIISEDQDHNRDLVVEIAICHATETLNRDLDILRKNLSDRFKELVTAGAYPADAENPATLVRPIQNGMDYIGQANEITPPVFAKSGRRLLELLYPNFIPIPSFNIFNQNRFRKFWFVGNTSASFGGENIRIVEDEYLKKTDKPQGFFQQYGALLIAALVFLGCLIGGAVVPLG